MHATAPAPAPRRRSRKAAAPPLVAAAGAALARWHHLRADAATWLPVAPPLPSMDRRLRDLEARGYGTLARPFTRGLASQGVPADVAQRELAERIRDGRLVPRVGGGWQLARV